MTRRSLPFALSAVALVLGVAQPAHARCVGEFARVWPAPEAGPVPTNTRLLVHLGGDRWSGADLSALRLVPSRGRTIGLRVAVDQKGGDGFRQQRMVVLAPENDLAPGVRYKLSSTVPLPQTLTYAVTAGPSADAVAPSAASVSAGAFVTEAFGCGDAHLIPITVAAPHDDRAPASALWARLRLARSSADADAGRWAADIVTPLTDGKFSFGHGMCFGTWPLEPGDRFVGRVSTLDFAMNESAPTTLTLEAR